MRYVYLLFGLMLIAARPVWAAASAAEIETETARLNQWFDARYEEQLSFSPIQQTMLGRKTSYAMIDDMSTAAQDALLAWRRNTAADMQANFDYEKLTADAQISWDLWLFALEQQSRAAQFRDNDYVFTQMFAFSTFFPTLLINYHGVASVQDMTDYISRIGAAARALDQLQVQSRASAALGVRPPRFAFDYVISESKKIIGGAPFDDSGADNPVWQDIKTKIAGLQKQGLVDSNQADALLEVARLALLNSWQPAYQRLIAWQQEDIANAVEPPRGVGSLPNGEAYYKERLEYFTTTKLTAAEIHAIGLAEVTRIQADMDVIIARLGFSGGRADFFTMLRESSDNPRLYYPDTDAGRQAYLDGATAAIQNIKNALPAYFGRLPKADLVVKRVEAFREQDGGAAHYAPGGPDGSRPGVFYAHLSDMTQEPKYQQEALAYHEGIPGHHMQLSIAQELTDIPQFRTQAENTVYSEGWGLYAEQLAAEMPGTYQDDYAKFGQLVLANWRAIRLVVDTGLHAKSWTEQQAIDYFAANSPMPMQAITSEVQRYLVIPGQATSYMIGKREIVRLRELAQQELGAKFDIRQFHDVVLGSGSLPLPLLERQVKNWIATQKVSS